MIWQVMYKRLLWWKLKILQKSQKLLQMSAWVHKLSQNSMPACQVDLVLCAETSVAVEHPVETRVLALSSLLNPQGWLLSEVSSASTWQVPCPH